MKIIPAAPPRTMNNRRTEDPANEAEIMIEMNGREHTKNLEIRIFSLSMLF